MDSNVEAGSKRALAGEPISLDRYRQERKHLGVEQYLLSLEEKLTEEQKEKMPGVMKGILGFATDPNTTPPLRGSSRIRKNDWG